MPTQHSLRLGGQTEPPSAVFHHRSRSECDCPIHCDGDPFTAPLGLPFADQVHVEPIPRHVAAAIYAAHHSYMPSLPDVNLTHHGLYHQGNLLGAITYRTPLISRKALYFSDDGDLLTDPRLDIETDLPAPLHPIARRLTPDTPTPSPTRQVVSGGQLAEAARICIGVDFPNLASASLAQSMDAFATTHASEYDYLLTFVRADYNASMIRALQDKGWTFFTASEPCQASNREHTQIRKAYKWQFLCPLPADNSQTALTNWLS